MARMVGTEKMDRPETIQAYDLRRAETFLTKVDEFVLLRLDTSDGQIWVRMHRTDFVSLAEHLADQAHRMEKRH